MDVQLLSLLGRVSMAALAGAVIGFEREVRGHPAGMRTHALVAAGAALFALSGTLDWGGPAADTDPTRIAAQVVSGLGFVGAGAILRDGLGVRGLTTAATLWASGALGIAAATGRPTLLLGVLIVFLAILLILRAMAPLTNRLTRSTLSLELVYESGHGTVGPLVQTVTASGSRIAHMVVDDTEEATTTIRTVRMLVYTPKTALHQFHDLVKSLESRDETRKVVMSLSHEEF